MLNRDVREIKNRIDEIDKSVDLLLRANRRSITTDLMDFFGKSKDRAKVFLVVDGESTVTQIVNKLNPMKQPNVSTRISELFDEDLIYVKKITNKGKIYEKTKKVKILKLEKILRRKFNIK